MGRDDRSLLLIGGAIILALGIAFAWVNFYEEQGGPTTNALSEYEDGLLGGDLIEIPLLINKNRKESNPKERYTVDIDYPEVSLANNLQLTKETNDIIEGFVDNTIEKFIKNVQEMYSPLVPESFSSDLTMNWRALLVSPSIISLRFDYSEYVAGAAHPSNETRILNYDLENHILLSTTDLFASSTQALPFLSQFTRAALKTQMSDEPEEIFHTQAIPGTEPRYENFQEIGITKEGLLVVFNPYQVAPYARGTVEVAIPLSDTENNIPVRSLIAPDILKAIKLSTENFKEASEEQTETKGEEN